MGLLRDAPRQHANIYRSARASRRGPERTSSGYYNNAHARGALRAPQRVLPRGCLHATPQRARQPAAPHCCAQHGTRALRHSHGCAVCGHGATPRKAAAALGHASNRGLHRGACRLRARTFCLISRSTVLHLMLPTCQNALPSCPSLWYPNARGLTTPPPLPSYHT